MNNDSCGDCHDGDVAPDQFIEWNETGHASFLARAVDGDVSSYYNPGCVTCHSVGNSPAADNGGFDDLAAEDGWALPAVLEAGNWEAMQADFGDVAQLANIQCESCHGPQDSDAHRDGAPRTAFNVGVCAQCHDAGSHHVRPDEWRTTGHANVELAIEEASFEHRGGTAGHCGRCHSGQGFVAYAANLMEGEDGSLSRDEEYLRGIGLEESQVEPVVCAACHDPHSAENPHQVRLYDEIEMLPSGFGVSGVGTGAVCMACHNTRNGIREDGVELTSHGGPHYPAQTDILFGYNAFFVGPGGFEISNHAAIENTCAGCHMAEAEDHGAYGDHTWRVDDETICASCHGEGVNGDALLHGIADNIDRVEEATLEAVLDLMAEGIDDEGSIEVIAWDPETDCYSDEAESIGQYPVSAELAHIHGRLGLAVTFPAAVSWTRGGDDCSGTHRSTTVYFQLASLEVDGEGMIPPNDILVRAMWNIELLHGDGSHGAHNPGYVREVLSATYEAVTSH